ncbi:glutamine synthetase [Microbulbifer agarilyticus]|uniref:Glutamine synthetase n=1 Tax=Microbulbifer agarilyticus TaxID=260552 RepID=A0A1Q2M4T1_9GAMM|nr:glutamine synthetase family protein [Microbulbifer agarilyticus]AQQ67724.1 glutamine synthetase [Microbulbifer agarilyticus]
MDKITQWLAEHSISEVECLVPDMSGNARGKFTPTDKFLTQDSRLPESILVQTVTGDYVDEHNELVDPADTDMLLVPDPDSIRLNPWANEPTAQIIHDCYTRDGKPHPISSRNILKFVLDKYAEQGWKPVVAPEVEFYLVKKNLDPNEELSAPVGRSGRTEKTRQSYSIDAANEYEPIIEDMYDFSEAQGLDVDTLIHESGTAQMEINFLHGDPLKLADQVFTFKRTVRETALRHGIYATFMAKPMADEPGSALHLHQSIVDVNTGKNIFVDDEGAENVRFMHFIGGMQKYTPGFMTFFAPNVNSYRRFTKENAAPISLHWGYDNRTTGLRVPDSSPQAKRLENRFPGADCNPYLAIATSLACGYLGMMNKIEPTKAYEGDCSVEPISLPRTQEHALSLMAECPEAVEMFGDTFVRAWAAIKRDEYEEFNRVISSWEREFLLLNV